jgi:hypothetical protein
MPEAAEEFSWSVETHEHRHRSTDWYWALGVTAVVSALACIFFGNFFLAVIILIAAGSVATLAARGPREHAVIINRRGISIDGTLYAFASMHSFWIERELEAPRLYLSTTGFLAPHFSLPIPEGVDAVALHQFLKRFVEEEEQGPHIGEHVAELLGL